MNEKVQIAREGQLSRFDWLLPKGVITQTIKKLRMNKEETRLKEARDNDVPWTLAIERPRTHPHVSRSVSA
jgi:hypothetical protein